MITNNRLLEYYNKAIAEYPQVKQISFNDLKKGVRLEERYWYNRHKDAETYNNVLSVFDKLINERGGY